MRADHTRLCGNDGSGSVLLRKTQVSVKSQRRQKANTHAETAGLRRVHC